MNLTETVIAAKKSDKAALEQLYNMYVGEVYIVIKGEFRFCLNAPFIFIYINILIVSLLFLLILISF